MDGHQYRTAVSGTVDDLIHFYPVGVTLCAPGAVLGLDQGRHWLATAVPGPFMITNMSLTSGAAAAAGGAATVPGRSAAAGQHRALRVLSWQPEQRSLRIGPGPAAYIEVHQNANPGWVASAGRPAPDCRAA